MAFSNGAPSIVQDGLVFAMDAGNTLSYPGSGTTVTDISKETEGTLVNSVFSSDKGGIFQFDGSDNRGYFPLLSEYLSNSSQPFSISLWIKNGDVLADFDVYLTFATSTNWNQGMILWYDTADSGLLSFSLDGYGSKTATYSMDATAMKQWNYVVGTWSVTICHY